MQIAERMAITVGILFIATLQWAAAQKLKIDMGIIHTDCTEICPSKEERRSAHQNIRKEAWTMLANFTVIPECGDGLWKRVAYLNMSDPSQQCPSAWRLYSTNGVRACGRPVTSGQSCPAVVYPTGQQYQRVCGRIIGYQVETPGAFFSVFADQQPPTIDDPYVDGVSVTHGHPRSHIWTFAAGETQGFYRYGAGPDCPCSRSEATLAPHYIGNNYYCESGNSVDNDPPGQGLYSSDPLWDGQQCEAQCCSNGKSPPWFTVQLSNLTLDDIEVRICADESTSNEDTPVELIELYMQ